MVNILPLISHNKARFPLHHGQAWDTACGSSTPRKPEHQHHHHKNWDRNSQYQTINYPEGHSIIAFYNFSCWKTRTEGHSIYIFHFAKWKISQATVFSEKVEKGREGFFKQLLQVQPQTDEKQKEKIGRALSPRRGIVWAEGTRC